MANGVSCPLKFGQIIWTLSIEPLGGFKTLSKEWITFNPDFVKNSQPPK